MHACRLILSFASLLLVTSAAAQETILDTGTIELGEPASGVLFDNWKAQAFTLPDVTVIDSAEVFMYRNNVPEVAGEFKVAIFSSGADGLPDSRIFEAPFTVPITSPVESPDWYGASALEWELAAGSYWLAVLADTENELIGQLPTRPADPGTRDRAFWRGPKDPPDGPPEPGFWQFDVNANLRHGFRVQGRSVPEPVAGQVFLIAMGIRLANNPTSIKPKDNQ